MQFSIAWTTTSVLLLQLFFSFLSFPILCDHWLTVAHWLSLHCSLEHLTPKCDFCYFMPCMALLSSFHLQTSSYFMRSWLRSLLFFYRTDHLSIYIHLGLSTKNTAWSMCQVHTYINWRYLLYLVPNLNLLNLPWISLSLRATSECALLCKNLVFETP